MNLPQMSLRRWFWLLITAGIAWCWVGGRWDADSARPGWMRKFQHGVIAQPVLTLEIPAEFIFKLAREGTTGVLKKIAFSPPGAGPGGLTDLELNEQVRDLQNENAQLKAMLQDANERLLALQHLEMIGIRSGDVVSATVLGLGTGPEQSKLFIDKGAQDGIAANNAVVAPLQQVTLLGRVILAGQKECTVYLLTDPSISVQAQIVRPRVLPASGRTPPTGVVTDLPVTTSPCLVQGIGNNQMRSLNVDVQQGIPPMPGDLVRLTDREWPAKVQNMVIGQIEKVSQRIDQPLRYELLISPRVAATTQRSVMVLTAK